MKSILLLVLAFVLPGLASAHILNTTRADVAFDASPRFTVEVDVDLTVAFGAGDAYYQFSLLPKGEQEGPMRGIFAKLAGEMTARFGGEAAALRLTDWEVPQASRQVYNDYYTGKMTRLLMEGTIPTGRSPFVLETSASSTIVEFPLALTVERSDQGARKTRWLEVQGLASEPFDYDHVPSGERAAIPETGKTVRGADLNPFERFWAVQFGTLGRYLKLGFHHIVPEGTDHILFVLGLFFFGISWRKLISQTTVFTIAHATTLYLSTQEIFSMPSRIVEPGIAFSIAFIAVENIWKPRLGMLRLSIVFFFGLVHGLGFASDLKELRLPAHELFPALLGFNFGVDFGQLFVIGIAFLLVGWFRNRPWYFRRIALPGSILIACVGIYWMVERIIFYAHLSAM